MGLPVALRQVDPAVQDFWLRFPDRLTLQAPRSEQAIAEAKPIKFKSGMTLQRLFDQLGKTGAWSVTGFRTWKNWASSVSGPGMGEILEGIQAGLSCSQSPSQADALEVIHLLALSRAGASHQGGLTAFRDLLLRLARRNGADIPPRAECRRISIQGERFAGVLPSSRGSMISANGGVLGRAHRIRSFDYHAKRTPLDASNENAAESRGMEIHRRLETSS